MHGRPAGLGLEENKWRSPRNHLAVRATSRPKLLRSLQSAETPPKPDGIKEDLGFGTELNAAAQDLGISA